MDSEIRAHILRALMEEGFLKILIPPFLLMSPHMSFKEEKRI